MINPTIQDYINDLLVENRQLFAINEDLRSKIKFYNSKRFNLEKVAHTEKQWAFVLKITAQIMGLYGVIRINEKDIKDNLQKIEDLRNGVIKEI